MTDLFDEKAAARILDVHPRTMRRWRERGLVAHYRTPTGSIRYRLDDLLEAGRTVYVPATGRTCPQMPSRAPFHSEPSTCD